MSVRAHDHCAARLFSFPARLLLKKNNLHIDIIFDPDNKLEVFNPDGNQDKAKVHDIILESAITTIMDHEDSVAAVDAEDKVLGYKNWLGLMKGDLQTEFEKDGILVCIKYNISKSRCYNIKRQ